MVENPPNLYYKELAWGWRDGSGGKSADRSAEDLGWVPSTHRVADNCLELQFQWVWLSLLTPVGSCMHVVGKHTHIHKIKFTNI